MIYLADHRLRDHPAGAGQSLDEAGHMKTAALPLKRQSKAAACWRTLRQSHPDLWRLDAVGVRLSVPDLLDRIDLVQDGARRHALLPWWDFEPDRRGWRSLGLSPDTIGRTSTVRDEFVKRFANSVVTSASASFLAVVIGSLAAYGLSRFSYRLGPMRNKDIAFFFLSQLILPPVVLALPFLVLYKELALLDTIGHPALYA